LTIPAHSFEDFVNKGWQAGGQTDAAALAAEQRMRTMMHATADRLSNDMEFPLSQLRS